MLIATILVTTATASAALMLPTGPAMAGEITGSGKSTQGPAHANCICVFSGLEDGGDFEGQPAGPGAPPQDWGHVQQFVRDMGATVQDLKPSGEQPGSSCNGHTGFLVNPPPGTP
jgi:hypothetical protein